MNNSIQFCRLIEEAQAAGAFTVEVVKLMAESMDLEVWEVHELLERARVKWEDIKARMIENQIMEEKDTTTVTWNLPKWAADTIFETLELDSQSGAFDPELRQEIAEALEAIEEKTPE